MNTSEILLDQLLTEAERQKLTPGEMAKRTGLDQKACAKILKRQSLQPAFSSIGKLAEALGVTFRATFKRA